MLNELSAHLMEPELFNMFCEEFTGEVNRLSIERDAQIISHKGEFERVDRELDKAIQAVLGRVPGSKLKGQERRSGDAQERARRAYLGRQ